MGVPSSVVPYDARTDGPAEASLTEVPVAMILRLPQGDSQTKDRANAETRRALSLKPMASRTLPWAPSHTCFLSLALREELLVALGFPQR